MLEFFYIIGVDNVLVKIALDTHQPLFQFINAVDVCLVNMFLHGRHGHPYLITVYCI